MSKELQSYNPSSIDKIKTATAGLRVQDADNQKIKTILAYLFALLGISGQKIPTQLEEVVLIGFIKENVEIRLEEIKLAFTLALTGDFETELNLYGEPFSIKYLQRVLVDYQNYKRKIIKAETLRKFEESKKSEVKMNNIQRLSAISSLLSDETKQMIQDIGKEKNNPLERTKLPFHDTHQKWLALFDSLKFNWEVEKSGGRFINRYGQTLDIQGFFRYKADQLQRVTEYLENRNTDIL